MEPEVKKETLKMDPKLRTRAMVNSGILALQFGLVSLLSLKTGQTFMGIIGLLATIGTVNDTLTFYYVNKEK
jgi:hypothetical protein